MAHRTPSGSKGRPNRLTITYSDEDRRMLECYGTTMGLTLGYQPPLASSAYTHFHHALTIWYLAHRNDDCEDAPPQVSIP